MGFILVAIMFALSFFKSYEYHEQLLMFLSNFINKITYFVEFVYCNDATLVFKRIMKISINPPNLSFDFVNFSEFSFH